jgi:hypothetical protein
MRNRVTLLAAATVMGTIGGPAYAELGSDVPSDSTLLMQRLNEAGPTPYGMFDSGIFDVGVPLPRTPLRPVERIPRLQFGVVGKVPLGVQDLGALLYPSANTVPERCQSADPDSHCVNVLEGLNFFTKPHIAAEGLGPLNNQVFCLGCHESTAETVPTPGLLSPASCSFLGSTCVSLVSRAARSTPTNFKFTSLNPFNGGGRPAGCNSKLDSELLVQSEACPKPTDSRNLDALHNTGKTAAFTTFGDFNPSHNFFDPLDGVAGHGINNTMSQPLGGFVQHTRPAVGACVPKPIPPVEFDTNLAPSGPVDPKTGLYPSGFRRSVGERAGPPYIGRGLIEAVPTDDIKLLADPGGKQSHSSSLHNFTAKLGCTAPGQNVCITGRTNIIPNTIKQVTDVNGNLKQVTGFVGGVGRFGLRANGTEILQFVIGGAQGELSFTSLINLSEINLPMLFKGVVVSNVVEVMSGTQEPQACKDALSTTAELHLSSPFSERNLIRFVAPPEFGDALLGLLQSSDPTAPQPPQSEAFLVQRGAQLFGIDLKAFANRMIPGRMPPGGDRLDPNAINQSDRKLDCAGCHTPVRRTGKSPAEVVSETTPSKPFPLSFVWAPIFSDLLIHKMPVINAERFATTPRDPAVIKRGPFNTFDLPRSLAEDSFSNQKALADGREFRTAPLMGLGRIGPPFLHDARVYLSSLTVRGDGARGGAPAGTVTTNNTVTNAPLAVRTVDDALLAAIELHDLPAPDDNKTPAPGTGGGCPVPPGTNVNESPQDVCPPYDSATSKTNRSDSREVLLRFHNLPPEDQKALIEFLKQL